MKDRYTRDLFTQEQDISIARLTKEDVVRKSDKVCLMSDLIQQHEPYYPNIKQWFTKKVLPGIETEERIAYIGFCNEEPIVSAVLKRGMEAKFCHLHISDDHRNQGIGDLFFAMMALDLRRPTKEIHFTLPESLWCAKTAFFQSFGFEDVVTAKSQYRLFDEELRASADYSTVWKKAIEKLPNIISRISKYGGGIFNGLLMSIKPKYAEKIKNGDKYVEIRRKFNHKWEGCRVTVYSSSPNQALLGYATIKNVTKAPPERIWSEYEDYIGCTKEEFDEYTVGYGEVYAIPLNDFESYTSPVYLTQVSHLLDSEIRPPQSHLSLGNNDCWAKAVSIAELLHGRFRTYNSII